MEEIKDKLIWKIQRWGRSFPHLPRKFFLGLKNLQKWFSLVWKDRDWDDYFIFEALKFKIQNTANFIKERNRYVGAERDVEIMKTCVKLIQRIQDQFYDIEHCEYERVKFNFIDSEVPHSKNSKVLEIEILSQDFEPFFKKYPRIYKKALQVKDWPYTKKDNSTIAMWMSHYNHKRARRILFSLIERNIEKWWD